MVALLHPENPRSAGPALRLVVDNPDRPTAHTRDGTVGRRVDCPLPPGFRLAHPAAPPSAPTQTDMPWPLVVAVIACAVFGSLALVRSMQGAPPSDGDAVGPQGLAMAPAVVPAGVSGGDLVLGPGDRVVVAKPGDSLWSIAVSISPDADPRPIVATLIEANGSESVAIGQQIVIPGQLLD